VGYGDLPNPAETITPKFMFAVPGADTTVPHQGQHGSACEHGHGHNLLGTGRRPSALGRLCLVMVVRICLGGLPTETARRFDVDLAGRLFPFLPGGLGTVSLFSPA